MQASRIGTALVVTVLRYNLLAAPVDHCYGIGVEGFGDGGGDEVVPWNAVGACTVQRTVCANPEGGGLAMISVGLRTVYKASSMCLQLFNTKRQAVRTRRCRN